jgi:type II secretory pathway component PulC
MIKSPVFLAVILLMSALVAIGYQAVGLNKIRQKKIYVASQTSEIAKPQKPVAGLPTLADLAKQNLMGVPAKKGAEVSAAGDAAKQAAIKFTLMGTIITSGDSKKSSAFIQGSKDSHRYYVGDKLEGGVILNAVEANSVVLKRNGKLETLKYPENVATSLPAPPAPLVVTPPGATPPPAASNPAPGARPADRMMNLRERLKNAQANPKFQPHPAVPQPGNH